MTELYSLTFSNIKGFFAHIHKRNGFWRPQLLVMNSDKDIGSVTFRELKQYDDELEIYTKMFEYITAFHGVSGMFAFTHVEVPENSEPYNTFNIIEWYAVSMEESMTFLLPYVTDPVTKEIWSVEGTGVHHYKPSFLARVQQEFDAAFARETDLLCSEVTKKLERRGFMIKEFGKARANRRFSTMKSYNKAR